MRRLCEAIRVGQGAAMAAVAMVAALAAPADARRLELPPVPANVVIAEVLAVPQFGYAPYVQLQNRGANAVSLAGWALHYRASAGHGWQTAPLTGTMASGGAWLIRTAQMAGPVSPDAQINLVMSASGGTLVLSNHTLPLGPECAGQVDALGYGDSDCGEGGLVPVSEPAVLVRRDDGCADTDDNAADFLVSGLPTPHNSQFASVTCNDVALGVAGPATYSRFSAIEYGVVVTTGGSVAAPYVITATLPPATTLISSSAPAQAHGRQVTITLNTLAVHAPLEVVLVVDPAQASGELVLRAGVRTSRGDAHMANNFGASSPASLSDRRVLLPVVARP